MGCFTFLTAESSHHGGICATMNKIYEKKIEQSQSGSFEGIFVHVKPHGLLSAEYNRSRHKCFFCLNVLSYVFSKAFSRILVFMSFKRTETLHDWEE